MSDENAKHALIALGANLPVEGQMPAETLRHAIAALAGAGFRIVAISRFYATPCFPAGAGPDYVNAAVRLDIGAQGDAGAVLAALHRIEAQFGRVRTQRWGMRSLDLDLLALGDQVMPDAATQMRWRDLPADRQAVETPDQLILPHPRLQDRAFVLVPLADVAPEWTHPISGQSVLEMLESLPEQDRAAVTPL